MINYFCDRSQQLVVRPLLVLFKQLVGEKTLIGQGPQTTAQNARDAASNGRT